MTLYEKFISENTMIHFFFFILHDKYTFHPITTLQHGQGKSNYIDDISRYIHTCAYTSTYECP